MPRAPDPNKEKAKQLFMSGMKLVEIASQLNLPAGTIRRWKCTYKWDSERSDNKASVRNHKGGQPGNHNGTGPPGNKNAVKYGFFEKYLPKDTLDIIKETETKSPIDLLWDQIQLQYAAIIRAQKIAYVKNQEDITKVITKLSQGDKSQTFEWEYQQAWDKQNSFLQAQSRAIAALNNLIKHYDEMCNSSLATEEQKLRIEKLRAETEQIKGTDSKEAIEKLDIVLGSIKGVV